MQHCRLFLRASQMHVAVVVARDHNNWDRENGGHDSPFAVCQSTRYRGGHGCPNLCKHRSWGTQLGWQIGNEWERWGGFFDVLRQANMYSRTCIEAEWNGHILDNRCCTNNGICSNVRPGGSIEVSCLVRDPATYSPESWAQGRLGNNGNRGQLDIGMWDYKVTDDRKVEWGPSPPADAYLPRSIASPEWQASFPATDFSQGEFYSGTCRAAGGTSGNHGPRTLFVTTNIDTICV